MSKQYYYMYLWMGMCTQYTTEIVTDFYIWSWNWATHMYTHVGGANVDNAVWLYLKAAKQVVKLFGGEVPCQLDKHIMNVLNNYFMFAILRRPYPVKVSQTQNFLFDAETN